MLFLIKMLQVFKNILQLSCTSLSLLQIVNSSTYTHFGFRILIEKVISVPM